MTEFALYRYKLSVENSWSDSITIRVFHNELDIGITKIWLRHVGLKPRILTIPVAKHWVHFLVPRPKPRTSIWAPVTPFTPVVWISIIIMLIIQSLFVYSKARLFPTRASKSNVKKFFKFIP